MLIKRPSMGFAWIWGVQLGEDSAPIGWIYAGVYIYINTCEITCVHVYMYVYMYRCIDVYMYICIYVYMYLCIYIEVIDSMLGDCALATANLTS